MPADISHRPLSISYDIDCDVWDYETNSFVEIGIHVCLLRLVCSVVDPDFLVSGPCLVGPGLPLLRHFFVGSESGSGRRRPN
jgi:hypothetical protein